jgi:hypothetical protein
MAFNFISAGLQAAPALAGLAFGQNNIFSGKGRQAAREGERAFQASQNMGIGDKYYSYLSSKQSQANRGLSGSTIGLAERAAARGTASGIGALKSKNLLLGGLSKITRANQDAGMELAARNEQAVNVNQDAADLATFQIAGLEQENVLRKNQEAQDYWANRRAESNQAITSNLTALGKAVGSGFMPSTGGREGGLDAMRKASILKSQGDFTSRLAGLKASLPKITPPKYNPK